MNKNILSVTIVLLLAVGIIYQLMIFFQSEKTSLPDVEISTLRNESTSLEEIGNEKDVLVILYRSNCDFCKKETTGIHEIASQFEGIELVFLSKEELPVIRKYKQTYFPTNLDNITFGKTSERTLNELANDDLVYPYILWYNKDKVLRTRRKGMVSPERILQVITADKQKQS